MKDLNLIRQEIDSVDKQILALYEQRMALAEEVATYKIATGKKVYDKQREDEKLDSLSSRAKDDFSKQGIRELFEQIMSTSRKKQYQLLAAHGLRQELDFECQDSYDFDGKKICYQGVEGAYSQVALNKFFGESDVKSFHVDTWREAMEAIKSGEADYAVLPIENSFAGSVYENYDLLIEYGMTIIGEETISIEHALLGVEGASISDIKKVYSHPQAIMQCDGYLRNYHSDWEAEALRNTAVSAMKVKEDNDIHQAAIGSELNAAIYGLKILEKSIQDSKTNETRFIIISEDKKYLKSANKISVCFELPNEKGSLYRILSHFIFNGLDLSKIESRPVKDKNWEYRFFVDLTGNLLDDAVKNALLGINEEASILRILGNY